MSSIFAQKICLTQKMFLPLQLKQRWRFSVVAQHAALSRRKPGFESRIRYSPSQNAFPDGMHFLYVTYPQAADFLRPPPVWKIFPI